MANYVIECTVSELTVKETEVIEKETELINEETGVTKKEIELTKKGTEVAIKIVGSEGYAIKQGEKTYNVFCPENMPETGKTVQNYIADSETEFTVNSDFENILTQASMSGKKIRLTIELANKEDLKVYIRSEGNNLFLPIKSVSLLRK